MRHFSFWQSPWLCRSSFVVVSLAGLVRSVPPFLGGETGVQCVPQPSPPLGIKSTGSPSQPHFPDIKIVYHLGC